jgi:hypothetical protein
MQRMSPEELMEIINKGLERLMMGIEDGALKQRYFGLVHNRSLLALDFYGKTEGTYPASLVTFLCQIRIVN